tara:strand:- start:6849 stop:7091 length:243 start_codon:yes stop_codon:yes gene_type:complete
MVKGFSENSKREDIKSEDENSKKGLAKILAEKKFTYTLPGKKQINIFATVVLSLNLIFVLGIFLFFKNQQFHDFIFNVGR